MKRFEKGDVIIYRHKKGFRVRAIVLESKDDSIKIENYELKKVWIKDNARNEITIE